MVGGRPPMFSASYKDGQDGLTAVKTTAGLRQGRLRPYLELMRPANLFTAAADVLAGFAVAGLSNPQVLPWLLLSTTCLYAGGVVLNDVFDADLDAQERPERPIPSRRASKRAAALQGVGLLGAGVAAALLASPASGAIAGAIAACAILYDGWGKHRTVAGAFNMGTCRALNLLLGMSATPAVAVGQRWLVSLLPLAYVAAVTTVSRGEVHGSRRPHTLLALGLLAGVVAALAALAFAPMISAFYLLFLLLFAWRVLPSFWRVYRQPEPAVARAAVQAAVLGVVMLDATIGTGYAGPIYGLGILALLPVASGLARVFAVT